MKTTISLPDEDHRRLRKIAIDRSTTMAELIGEAVRERYFPGEGQKKEGERRPPFTELRGLLAHAPATEKEVKELKNLWKRTPK